MQTKKGFILIYTILVGLICLTIMMYTFDIQVGEVKYSTSAKGYILREDNYQKHKEYLLTSFSKYIETNKVKIKADGITKYFSDYTGQIAEYKTIKPETIKEEISTVSYSNTTNEFIFKTPCKNGSNRNDYFKLEAIGEGFRMTFIKTEYHD